jgi:lysophospholipase L1-like esterase
LYRGVRGASRAACSSLLPYVWLRLHRRATITELMKRRRDMKTVLCYGDSNTWGYDAVTEGRLAADVRWVNVLARELGDGYTVIAEGLNGRTTVWNDPVEGEYKNGKTYLIPCLESHYPIDLVVIMLGTNDLKHRFGLSAYDIASGAGTLVDIVQKSEFGIEGHPPKVLLVTPAHTAVAGTRFAEMLADADTVSRDLGRFYREVSTEHACAFLDAATVIVSCKTDGIHLDASEHHKLGRAVAAEVRRILN